MNEQEFNKMVITAIQKTIKQGYRSTTDRSTTENACMYNNGSGGCCVVGHMMDKQELAKYGNKFMDVYELHTLGFKEDLTSTQLTFLSKLQDCHDTAVLVDFVSSFVDNLETCDTSSKYKQVISLALAPYRLENK